jgi:hypothetical protein
MQDSSLQYLNLELVDSIDPRSFRSLKPYPWINPIGLIKPNELEKLLQELPPISAFTPNFGYERKNNQASHDRYVLKYEENMDLSIHWHQFIQELRGDTYRKLICRLLGTRNVGLSFEWHYATRGTSVSPHCDSRRKIGTHIFYMNSTEDWKPEWGGQTLVLDDHGKFHRDSNPSIDSFPSQVAASIGENSSLIFGRGENSWHAVRELTCPDDAYRKIFVVRFEKVQPVRTLGKKIMRFISGKGFTTPKKSTIY